eukprot:TRINITY_DN21729_c0_g1_i1.p1 TRINITY_DN21729_c0_g1~~TRINITY_DN21729_c0_g1_i1.p1  ORF type:complete len:273 (-),score=70.21 TRINITY_DN21729_c0_g1_i1:161-979(-)
MSDFDDIKEWLDHILGEKNVNFEVTPETVQFLRNLRLKNIQKEKLLQATLEETEVLSREYEGELKRLDTILKDLGVQHLNLSGSANSYLQVLADSCVALDEDNIGRGMEVALSRAISKKTETGPQISLIKDKIEAVKVDNLKLYSQLERLEEAVKYADKEGEADLELTKSQTKKLDFMNAKEKQYRSGLEKDEMAHFKLTGGDKNLTHDKIREIEEKLVDLDGKVEEAKRTISGYLNLPPSLDLARLEISKAEAELEELTSELNINIASVHL